MSSPMDIDSKKPAKCNSMGTPREFGGGDSGFGFGVGGESGSCGSGGSGGVGLEVLEEDGDSIRMLVRGVGSSFANAWRRTIMGEVDIMAIDQLFIHENTTMTHDELLFHRLGLIPLRSDGPTLDRFKPRNLCDCDDGCPSCQAKFTLHVVNRSDETVQVTTKDLRSHYSGVVPVRDDILIVKLGKNQEISFTAFAVKSNSRHENNAKWSPVTIAAYRPTALVKVDSDLMNKHLTPDQQRKVCNSEPAQVFRYNEVSERSEPHPEAHLRATFVGDFMETLADILHPADGKDQTKQFSEVTELEESSGKVPRHPMELVHPMISMVPHRSEFLFPIISTGSLPPRQIAIRALASLQNRLLAINLLQKRAKLN